MRLAVVFLFALAASAEFEVPGAVPVDRLIRNVETYIGDNPNDTKAYYTLARLHSLALAYKSDKIRAFVRRGTLARCRSSLPQEARRRGHA